MGRGKSWSREESEAVAKAWKQSSEVIVSPREQNGKRFIAELYQRFLDLAPKDPSVLDGRWTSRSQTAVKTQFDAIGDDIQKFNVVMSKVASEAVKRGMDANEQRVLRAAIAVHLGNTDGAIEFDNTDSNESDWKLYEAWRILKICPRFSAANWHGMRNVLPANTNGSNTELPSTSPAQQTTQIQSENHSYARTDNLQSPGGTPMRLLANAANSIQLIPNGINPMTPLADQSAVPGDPMSQHHGGLDRNSYPQQTGNNFGIRPDRRHRKRPSEAASDGQQASKKQRSSPAETMASGSSSLELIAQALGALSDALSEYNALSLFSRPDMEGRREQKIFLEAMAEKHALKAKLDRDRVLNQVRQGTNRHGAHSFSQ